VTVNHEAIWDTLPRDTFIRLAGWFPRTGVGQELLSREPWHSEATPFAFTRSAQGLVSVDGYRAPTPPETLYDPRLEVVDSAGNVLIWSIVGPIPGRPVESFHTVAFDPGAFVLTI
jgi:hypothetical protein